MATNLPLPQSQSTLFAAIDMGSNSFKMLIVSSDSTGKFFTVNRLKESVVLGRDAATISFQSQNRALIALHKFNQVLRSHHIPADRTRCVATAAIREATNTASFTDFIRERTGLQIDVLSGEEEARLCYLGVLQFLPIYEKLVLNVDIGGRSTEFVIGKKGEVVFGTSLKLGHVNLTQKFVSKGLISEMREHIRSVIQESGLVEKVQEFGYEVAVGSSGTARTVEKAVFHGYAHDINNGADELLGGQRRDWKFSRGELKSVVEKLCSESVDRRDGLFNRRSEFIVAGAVLLEEIFEMLGVEEMETSGYSLGEGVIADTLAKVYDGYDLYVNARWRSIVRLASRFNNTKRMRAAAQCAVIAKEIFEGFRKCNELASDQNSAGVSLDDRDLEYLEAACMLHNIGVYTGKNGYHKESFHIIMNGGHLHGYDDYEVKLIALLAKHHRKKFPKFGHSSLKEFPEEAKQKFGILCAIIRISFILRQYECMELQGMELSQFHEGFKLVFREVKDVPGAHDNQELIAEDIEAELRKELERFKMVSRQDFQVVVPSRIQDRQRDERTSKV